MYKHRLVAPFWQDVSSSLIDVILQQCVDKTKPLLRAFLEAPSGNLLCKIKKRNSYLKNTVGSSCNEVPIVSGDGLDLVVEQVLLNLDCSTGTRKFGKLGNETRPIMS